MEETKPPVVSVSTMPEWKSMTLGLKRIQKVLALLGDPHHAFPHILVGGTNGKGTVAYNLACRRGPDCGLFLSPHLCDIRERITLAGRWIDDTVWQAAEKKIQATGMSDQLSFFEWMLALAVVMFAEIGVPFAIFEVGLGGRYDATNALQPLVSAITNVSLDHTQILGDTQEAIALEKIEIARSGRPFMYPRELDRYHAVSMRLENIGCQRHPLLLPCGMSGNRLLINHIGHVLQWPHPDHSLVMLPGRREIIPGTPSFFLDGAHNPAGWKGMIRWLRESNQPSVHILCGLSESRDAHEFLRILEPVTRSLRVWQRGAARELTKEAWPPNTAFVEELGPDFAQDAPWLVCGSLYLVGAFREILVKKRLVATVEDTMIAGRRGMD